MRCLERETGVRVAARRLVWLAQNDYLWKNREQHPQNIGCHDIADAFALRVNEKEIERMRRGLDAEEYETDKGSCLVHFDKAKLVAAGVHPAMVDLYRIVRKKFK